MFVIKPSEVEIIKLLDSMIIKKSTGYDEFQMSHLVKTKLNSTIFLVKLINSIIDNEVWPDQLKKQVVRPVYKKGQGH